MQAGAQQQQQQQQQRSCSELRMPLVLGQPPADTAVFAPVMAALQELQVSGGCLLSCILACFPSSKAFW
jgi:hypothetical protein